MLWMLVLLFLPVEEAPDIPEAPLPSCRACAGNRIARARTDPLPFGPPAIFAWSATGDTGAC
jgi:hypothetical protein